MSHYLCVLFFVLFFHGEWIYGSFFECLSCFGAKILYLTFVIFTTLKLLGRTFNPDVLTMFISAETTASNFYKHNSVFHSDAMTPNSFSVFLKLVIISFKTKSLMCYFKYLNHSLVHNIVNTNLNSVLILISLRITRNTTIIYSL